MGKQHGFKRAELLSFCHGVLSFLLRCVRSSCKVPAVVDLDASCADELEQRQEGRYVCAAAFLVAEQLAHFLQAALEQAAQHVGDAACRRRQTVR